MSMLIANACTREILLEFQPQFEGYCRLEFICDGILLRFFCECSKSQKYDHKKFQFLYSDYSCDEFSQKFSHPSFLPLSQIFSSAK